VQDGNWSKLHAQVKDILGDNVFSFQKIDENGQLIIRTSCLAVPLEDLYDNQEKVSIQGENNSFCRFVGQPEKIVTLLKRISQ